MKICGLFSTLLVLIAITCLFGAQGQFQEQYATPSSGSLPPQSYTTPTVSAHISAPVKTAIVGQTPVQAGPSLWIAAGTWTEYVLIPQGATVSLLAISPVGANGYLSELLNGTTYNYNFYFYPNSQLTFYADTIGQHTLSFSVNGQSSNQVVIDVTQPSNYPQSTNYYSKYYPRDYYDYYPWDYYGYYPWDYYSGYYAPPDGNHGKDHKENHGKDHKENHGKDHKENHGKDHKENHK